MLLLPALFVFHPIIATAHIRVIGLGQEGLAKGEEDLVLLGNVGPQQLDILPGQLHHFRGLPAAGFETARGL